MHKWTIHKIANDLKSNYEFTDSLAKIYTSLIYYFNGENRDYDLNKGIALVGTFGAGKTTLFRVIRKYLKLIENPNPNLFKITSTEDIITEMQRSNHLDSELLYNRNGVYKRPLNIVINEFGFDYDGKTYGTQNRELIEMFLMKRYDIFQEHGKLTHVTTNMDALDLKEIFTVRIIDRFKEMFNMIPVQGGSFRK